MINSISSFRRVQRADVHSGDAHALHNAERVFSANSTFILCGYVERHIGIAILFVRLSVSDIATKQLNLSAKFFHRMLYKIPTGSFSVGS